MGIQSGDRLPPSRLNTRAVRISRITALSLTSGTITPVSQDSEDFDNFSAVAVPTSSILLPVAGLWGLAAYGGFASNATGVRRLLIEVGSTGVYPTIDERGAVSGDATHITLSGSYVAAAGDTLRLNAHHTAGVALNLLAGAYLTAWLIAS